MRTYYSQIVFPLYRPLEESQICAESLTKVLECYKLHKTKSLRCAEEVKAFVDCVQETRLVSLFDLIFFTFGNIPFEM